MEEFIMKKTNDIQNENFIFIPDEIKYQFDSYIEKVIIPLLEAGEDTPIIEPQYWDLLIVLRYSGLRTQEVLHIIDESVSEDTECFQYDSPEYWNDRLHYSIPFMKTRMLYMNNKIKLPQMAQTNMISQAIIRQMKRVKTLPPTLNGCYYLFREMNSQSKIVPISSIKLNRILKKISETIPLNTFNGAIYKLSPRQFRATAIKDMVKLHNI